MSMERKVRVQFIVLAILTVSVQCTWEWAQRNETEFCRDVLSCSRNGTNQTLASDEETNHYENDTSICELARRCNTTAYKYNEWEVKGSYHQGNRNKTEFCSTLNSCKNVTNGDSHDYETQYLRNISHYCPYSDFCGLGASMKVPAMDSKSISCCVNCSCRSDCGLHKECCFPKQDNYRAVETENLTCIDLTLAGISTSFYMVDTCPNGTKCYDQEIVLNPISSALTKRIYINKKCADCHLQDRKCESACITWSMDVTFKADADDVLSCVTDTCAGNSIHGFPQQHWFWIRNFVCGKDYKNSCPRSTKDQGLIDACKNIHAPVFVKLNKKGRMFRNVYCIMCNKYMAWYQSTRICDSTIGQLTRWQPLSIVLDFDVIHNTQADPCRKNNALMISQTPQITCRTVLCPEWMVKVDGICRHFTKEWRNSYITFQLILRPYNNVQIKASTFQNMTKKDRFHIYTWLSNECGLDLNITDPLLVGSKIKIYILPVTIENVIMVREFLFRMQYRMSYTKPASLFAFIKRCVESKWKIARDGNVYHLSAEFYPYKSFIPNGKTERKHISLNNTYSESPLPTVYTLITISRSFYYYDYAIESKFQGLAVIITQMAYCERVELSLDEVDLLYGQIRIIYNNKTLGDAEFTAKYIGKDKGRPTLTHISVCTKDMGIDVKNTGYPLSTLSFLKIVALLVVTML